jgi:hypothetical protein
MDQQPYNMYHIRSLFLLIGLLLPFISNAQHQPVPEKERDAALHRIAALIKENYVFEKKGAEIATELLSQYSKGALRNAATWHMFDSLVTNIIHRHDGHLYVRYGPDIVKSLNAPEDTAAQQEDQFYYGPDARKNNFGFSEVKILDRNIGYIKLSEINISAKSLPVLYAAMQFVANTGALIIDLRDNGGGGSDVGPVLESYFLPPGKTLLEIRKRSGAAESERSVNWLVQEKYQQPLYILINKKTASAAEAIAFILQAQGRARVVGQPSAGGAHMNSWYPVNGSVYVSVSTAAPVLPGTTSNWERKGVQPDDITAPGAELEHVLQREKQ